MRLAILLLAPLLCREAAATGEGVINFWKQTSNADNFYLVSPNSTEIAFMNTQFWKILTYTPFFDTRQVTRAVHSQVRMLFISACALPERRGILARACTRTATRST